MSPHNSKDDNSVTLSMTGYLRESKSEGFPLSEILLLKTKPWEAFLRDA